MMPEIHIVKLLTGQDNLQPHRLQIMQPMLHPGQSPG